MTKIYRAVPKKTKGQPSEYFTRSKKTNPHTLKEIARLYKLSNESKVALWRDIADRLRAPSRQAVEVNLEQLARIAKDKETLLVPGKVLASGQIGVAVTVAALSFSEAAKVKIHAAGGRSISIDELSRENPKGSGVRIIG